MRRSWIGLTAAVAVVGIAGCGGSDSDTQSTSADQPARGFEQDSDAQPKPKVGDRRITATARFYAPVGARVYMRSPGGDESQCTKDEADVHAELDHSPQDVNFGFIAKSGGSCNILPSDTTFIIQVTVGGSRAKYYFAKVFVSQGVTGNDFTVECLRKDPTFQSLGCTQFNQRADRDRLRVDLNTP
jgi:hypothetical protein